MMSASPDMHTAFNMLLCLYARGDKQKVKRHFVKMLTIPVRGMTEEDEEKATETMTDYDLQMNPERKDGLKEELHRRHEQSNEYLLTGARLVATLTDKEEDWITCYKNVIQELRIDYEMIASKLELDFAMAYMKHRRFDDAIDVLKGFERKDASLRAMAGTNLSFIYFLENDYNQAEKHADFAIRSDRYNARALVNKGNCLYMAGEYGRAKELYLEAIGVEADCVEAIYNLGLANLKINALSEAHQAFDKLYTILPNSPEALYQLAQIYEKGTTAAELEQAAKTYEMLLHKVPGDPNVCCRLGQVYEKLDDENTACHWHTEAHRHFPVSLNVISWLGVWYVKREMYEQAIDYFERAAAVQPGEVKWRLMVTSCYRRLGDYFKALELYQQIHEDHPQNVEALQYLEALCKDLGRPHDEYSKKLEKLRRSMPATTQQGMTKAPTANAPQQRTERPRPEAIQDKLPEESRNVMAAPRAGGAMAKAAPPERSQRPARPADDEDDFGDTDVASLLD